MAHERTGKQWIDFWAAQLSARVHDAEPGSEHETTMLHAYYSLMETEDESWKSNQYKYAEC